MTHEPDVVFSGTSTLKGHLARFTWQELSIGVLDVERLVHDRGRPHVLILASDEATKVWHEVENYALDMPLFPLVIGNHEQIPKDASAFVRLAPVMASPVEETIRNEVRELLQRSAWLYREVASVDASVELLVQNSVCEWVRSSVGVVGLVQIVRDSSVRDLTEQLELLRVTAHATVDRVPAARLSTDDLWTLLLIVSVPWSRAELVVQDEESAILTKFTIDTIGSRKLIMSADESVRSLVGPIVGSGSSWFPSTDDPFRDQLRALAKTPEELQALEILFKKRFSPEDVERLIAVLGRHK